MQGRLFMDFALRMVSILITQLVVHLLSFIVFVML